ncbi:MAG TPA: hypothetical protein VGG65_09040, partial [Thermoanaerobaculia bacterium]
LVTERLSKLGEASIQADSPDVEFAEKPKKRATGAGHHLHEQFEEIIEFAHFSVSVRQTTSFSGPGRPR